ncbi:MAG: DsbA family protein [Myxococcales bacterium]|nr:DsbA family protein [Myxococcales bacterium]
MSARCAWVGFLLLTACGGSQGPAVADGAEGKAVTEGESDGVCDRYTERLCQELGPRSEACGEASGLVEIMSDSACAAGMRDFEVTRSRVALLRRDCDKAIEHICASLGAESEGCQVMRQEFGDMAPGHCRSLLQQSPRILAQLQQREAALRPLGDADWKAITAADAPSFGAADAPVVLVEFSDFQCPYCAKAAETVQGIKEKYGDRVRFVFRQFPLSFHEHAAVAAQASLAAHAQGKFWEYHDLLFANQGALAGSDLRAYAERLGLDLKAFDAALEDENLSAKVSADMALGDRVQVNGTPTLFVNRRRVPNALDLEEVSEAIDGALARSAGD